MTTLLDAPRSHGLTFSFASVPPVVHELIDVELPSSEEFEIFIDDAHPELSRGVAVGHDDTRATPFAYKFAVDPRKVYRAERHTSYMVETSYDGWSYWDFLRD